MKARPTKTNKYSFYLILGLLALATTYVMWGYLAMLFLALVVVMVFEPVFEWLRARIKHSGLASFLTTLIFLIVMVIPLGFLVSVALTQASELISMMSYQLAKVEWSKSGMVQLAENIYPGLGNQLEEVIVNQQNQLIQMVQSAAQGLGQIVTKGVLPIVASGAKAIFDGVIFIMLLIYLFPVKKKLFERIKGLSPLDKTRTELLVRRFEQMVGVTIKSTLLVGLVQGTLGAIMLTILGVKASALWGLMMAIAAFIPLGSGLVWWPIGISLILTGWWVKGIIWIGFGLLVISTMDNVVRSKVISQGESALPELVTFLSVLGGMQVFGFLGFILGPIISILFLTALEFYRQDRKI